MTSPEALIVVAVNGSPSRPSRSRLLAEAVLSAMSSEAQDRNERAGGVSPGDVSGARPLDTSVIDLAELDPAALLGLASTPGVDAVRDQLVEAHVLIVATPVYRATYTALTKTIFDLLPQGALEGTVVVPIATGYGADHHLSVDHGLRPLVASLGGWTVPTGIYATKADITDDGTLSGALSARVVAAAGEALALASALTRR